MSRFLISSDAALADFAQRFIPANCTVRLPTGKEDPTINPKDGEIGIYTVFFEQAGLRLPLDPLLCDFLRYCNMSLCQLSPNGIRLVLGCSALNKILGVNLTHREIFWCYSLCHCPQDSKRYYFRARAGAPDLVKCLTKSEKGYHGGMVVVGGAWDDGNIHKIRPRFYDHVACPKKPSKKVVDFDSINPVINYNGVGKRSIGDHPRAVHNLLGYTPIDTDWLAERSNQPDWVGPSKRPSKLEDRLRVKKKTPTRPQIPTGIIIREGPVENVGVTFTGQVLGAAEKGKAVEVGPSQNTSETPTDPEINQLFNESDVEDTATMAPKKRNIAASLQKGGGSDTSPRGEGQQQKKQRKETIRYGFRKDTPPAEVNVVERSEENVRPSEDVLEDGAPDTIWRPVFKYGGRELMESDSLYKSPSVAAAIMYGTAKASDVAEHAQTPMFKGCGVMEGISYVVE